MLCAFGVFTTIIEHAADTIAAHDAMEDLSTRRAWPFDGQGLVGAVAQAI